MNSKRFTRAGQFQKSPAAAAILLLFAALCILGVVYLITASHLYLTADLLLHQPSLLLLNLLPILALLLWLLLLTGRRLFSVSLTGTIWILLAIAQRIKGEMRQEPLLPTDLALAKEALAIVKTFPIGRVALLLLLAAALLALLLFSYRAEKPRAPLPLRLVCACTAFFCLLGLNQLCYADADRYDSYPTFENPNMLLNQYDARGLVYSFLHQYNAMQTHTPSGYHAAEFAALEDTDWTSPVFDPAQPLDAQQPHIVMIMGESFSDLSENPHLDFSRTGDPLENFKAICAEEGTVSGHIIVPNFGGGTSNTEYDVLTGCATRYLDTEQPAYSLIHQPFDALPYQLRLLGYDTLAIHPGNAWFYNRQNVYPDLGFEECHFLEDSFDFETQEIAGYVNEAATFDQIIETLDAHITQEDTPLFSFTVTIQNHGPYERKFGDAAPGFDTDVALSDAQRDVLSQYFYGISLADAQIGRLKEYAESSEEPIVLVYFGDHLPGLSGSADIFRALDYPINADGDAAEQLGLYKTPYFIWCNESAKALRGDAEGLSLPADGTISSQFLGTTLLELFLPYYESSLQHANDSLRRELPVCTQYIYVNQDGAYLSPKELSEAQQEKVALLKNWQYYKLYDQKNLYDLNALQ